MRRYSFFLESKQYNITYYARNVDELDKRRICQVCDLCNQLVNNENDFHKKMGLDSYSQPVWGPATFHKFVNLHNPTFHKIFTAEINGDIYGIIWYKEFPDKNSEYKGKSGWISYVVVDESLRGQGIATKLMSLAKQYIKKNRPSIHLFLGVNYNNDAAKALYSKFGFKPVNQTMVRKL
jgi:ribosomal protein S18 acetylase RimI-like enzyme